MALTAATATVAVPAASATATATLGTTGLTAQQLAKRYAPVVVLRRLFGRGPGVYLDLAGDSLKPGCVYAGDGARCAPLDSAAVYAHVAREADRPGFLAVQYWLYW